MNLSVYEQLPYQADGRHVELRGPAGQVLELLADGPKTIQWSPVDRRALEVEVRILLTDYLPVGGLESPDVRWRMRYGHGKHTWQSPRVCPAAFGAGVPAFVNNSLPARGIVFRVAAREFDIELRNMGLQRVYHGDPYTTYTSTLISISFQPVFGMQTPLFPRVARGKGFNVTTLETVKTFQPFPPEANEFRLFDDNGLPFDSTAGAGIDFYGMDGYAIGLAQELEMYADWRPIPFLAAAWGAGEPDTSEFVHAEYR